MAECQEEKNPFLMSKNTNNTQSLIDCLKLIPKVGDKNAHILASSFKSH